jgi:DNA-binding NarL/FixJ family response regulator
VFSSSTEDELGIRAIQAGADGYIRRDVAVKELIQAVRQILDGHRYVSPRLAARMAESLARPKSTGLAALSNRELYVLRRIGQGRATGEIAKEMGLSVKTVSTYRSRVLEKLHLHTTAELVRFAIEHRISG